MNQKKAAIAFILVMVILDVLSLGLTIPVGAQLIKQLVTGENAEVKAIWYVNLFGAIWAFMQFFSSPIMGALSDRFGRRPILLLSAFGLGIDYILLALAPNLAWLFVGRVITGITAASFSTAQAYLADVTKPEERSAAFGMFGAAFGLGFILGPALGGWLSDFDLRLPFWISAGLTLVNAIYGYFVLPESLPPEKRSPFSWSRANPVGSLKLLLSKRGLLPMALTLFLYQLAHQAFPNIFVLYTLDRFSWTGSMIGGALTTVGILNFIVQGGLIRPAVKRFGERVLIFVGLTGGIVGFMLYATSWTGTMFFASTVVFALMGFFNASIQGVMSNQLGPTEQGKLSGANSSLNGIAGMIGPFLFGGTYALTKTLNLPVQYSGMPFALAAAFLGMALLLAFIYVPKRPFHKETVAV
jgi:DHA1 family tetracycline resistance protein-like MFS transporter